MFLARGLQTAASTRFYKSILKPVLGPYLEEELDVDQLDVQLSEGTIKLNSLNIKAAALNDALLASAGGGGSGSGRDGTGGARRVVLAAAVASVAAAMMNCPCRRSRS